MNFKPTTDSHEIAFVEVCHMLQRHAADLGALELLAIASNLVGKLIALQDQRLVTPAMAMEIVSVNIQHGNKQAMDQLFETEGNA